MEKGFSTASDSLVWHDIVFVSTPFPWALLMLAFLMVISLYFLFFSPRKSPSIPTKEISQSEMSPELPYLESTGDLSSFAQYLEAVSRLLPLEQRHLSFWQIAEIPWWDEKLTALRALEKSVYSHTIPHEEDIAPLYTRTWR